MTLSEDHARLDERMQSLRRDFDKLESSLRWLWRTVATALIGAVIALAVPNILGGG